MHQVLDVDSGFFVEHGAVVSDPKRASSCQAEIRHEILVRLEASSWVVADAHTTDSDRNKRAYCTVTHLVPISKRSQRDSAQGSEWLSRSADVSISGDGI